ncbi:MAG: regulatory protein SipA [Prochlorothrix sp.]|nr:DUF3148 domain-containing protein [Prochlorothrix sp.]
MAETPLETFSIGDRVQLVQRPPYLKTADPMPMLRPPDLVPVATEGEILEQRLTQTWVVRFPQGSFLVDRQYLKAT